MKKKLPSSRGRSPRKPDRAQPSLDEEGRRKAPSGVDQTNDSTFPYVQIRVIGSFQSLVPVRVIERTWKT